MNGEKLRAACVEWISFTITKYKPAELEPKQLAESMVEILEAEGILVEDVVRYIQVREGPLSLREFGHWAKACSITSAMQENPPVCAHCGAELRTREEAGAHTCSRSTQ